MCIRDRLLTYADHHAPPFAYDALIDAGAVLVWGDLEWEAPVSYTHLTLPTSDLV